MTAILLLTLASLWLTQDLWQPGWFSSHDGWSHLSRLAQYLTLLKDGQFPPRFSGTLLGHLGYPIFVFSYQLPFIWGSFFSFLGFSLPGALKLVFGLSLWWSAVGMYLLLRQWFKAVPAFLGAWLFIVAPYRLVLIFVRASVGEALALSFLPWLLYALARRNLLLIALFSALATLSHSLFWPMYLGLIATYLLLIKPHPSWLKGILLGLGLSAWYWLPVVVERRLIVFDQYYVNLAVGHLVELRQLLYSPWGYGFSHSGSEQDAMSFQVGISQWLAVGAVIGWWWFKRTVPKLVTWALAWFLLVIVLMVDWDPARYLWQNSPWLKPIDIPWRLLSAAVFTASFLAAWLVEEQKKLKWLLTAGWLLVAAYTNRNHLRINQAVLQPDEIYFNDPGTTTFLNEYRPRWRRSDKTAAVDPKVLAEAENDKIQIIINRSNLLEFTTDFSQARLVQVNLLYYPGWRFFRPDQELKLGEEIKLVTPETDERQSGFGPWSFAEIEGTLRLSAPAGRQHYRFTFSETPLRLTADLISLASALIFGSFCLQGLSLKARRCRLRLCP